MPTSLSAFILMVVLLWSACAGPLQAEPIARAAGPQATLLDMQAGVSEGTPAPGQGQGQAAEDLPWAAEPDGSADLTALASPAFEAQTLVLALAPPSMHGPAAWVSTTPQAWRRPPRGLCAAA
jgi:hypothetical protein